MEREYKGGGGEGKVGRKKKDETLQAEETTSDRLLIDYNMLLG